MKKKGTSGFFCFRKISAEKRANPPPTRRAISSEHNAAAIGFRGGRKHGRTRWGGGAGHSHEGSRGIPTRGGGSRTARPPPPLPSPASRASPEISEFELELESRGFLRFNFYYFSRFFFVFPLPAGVRRSRTRSLRVVALTGGPRDQASRAGPWSLVSYLWLWAFLLSCYFWPFLNPDDLKNLTKKAPPYLRANIWLNTL